MYVYIARACNVQTRIPNRKCLKHRVSKTIPSLHVCTSTVNSGQLDQPAVGVFGAQRYYGRRMRGDKLIGFLPF